MPRLPPFWTTVGAVWAGLKLKEQWDARYVQVASEDPAEGHIRLPNSARPVDGDAAESLYDPNVTTRQPRKKGCCMCCGVDCTLFWKAFGIVFALWVVYGIFSGIKWIITPAPTGLENMPAYSTSLGCENNDFFYNDEPKGFSYSVPVSEEYHDHTLKLRGGGVGTVLVKNAPVGAKDVTYTIVAQASRKEDVENINVETEDPASGEGRALLLSTPSIPLGEAAGGRCVRYDVVVHVPAGVAALNIHARAVAQVKFDAALDLRRLSVVLFKLDERNMLLPSARVLADVLELEAYQGWIVGETTVRKETDVTTQRSNAAAHLTVHPVPPADAAHPARATLRTTSGSGRTDIKYAAGAVPRTINSVHMSQSGGDLYLDYAKARFSGKIALKARSGYTMTGARALGAPGSRFDVEGRARQTIGDGDGPEWTHYAGDADGVDQIEVQGGGWVGLYM